MKRTEWLQETRKMRFEETYAGCKSGCVTHIEAALLYLVYDDRTFRRYMGKYDEGGLDALLDKRLTQTSHRCAPVDERMQLTEQYQNRYSDWNAKHFHTWYRKNDGAQCYTWDKTRLQEAGGKVDKHSLTQFEQAMKRLGIEMIAASSPQARLPKELALTGIIDIKLLELTVYFLIQRDITIFIPLIKKFAYFFVQCMTWRNFLITSKLL